MHHRTATPRQEFRDQENERVEASTSLAETFQELRTLTVELAHFRGDRPTRKASQVKYRVNLGNAKSVFLISCPNDQCVGGDFDLSACLAKAVAQKTQSVIGEVICQGWRNSTSIDQVRCHNVLRYKLAVGYGPSLLSSAGNQGKAPTQSERENNGRSGSLTFKFQPRSASRRL